MDTYISSSELYTIMVRAEVAETRAMEIMAETRAAMYAACDRYSTVSAEKGYTNDAETQALWLEYGKRGEEFYTAQIAHNDAIGARQLATSNWLRTV